jgi:hypothetical protein
MSNIDDDEILELEISDDETFGLRGVGSPGKKRKVAEEVLDTGTPVERTVTLLPNSMITLPRRQFQPSSRSRSTSSRLSVHLRESISIKTESRWSTLNLHHQKLVLSDLSPVKTEATERTTQTPTTIRVSTVCSRKIPMDVQLRPGPSNVFLDLPLFSLSSKLRGMIVSAENLPKTT